MSIETATATPRTPVSASITMRGHTIIQDKPPENGGQDEGVMASELLLAGLLACQLSTFYKVAAKRRAPVTVQQLRGDLHFDDADEISHVTLHFSLQKSGEFSGNPDTLLKLTDRACTISKALQVPIEGGFEWVE